MLSLGILEDMPVEAAGGDQNSPRLREGETRGVVDATPGSREEAKRKGTNDAKNRKRDAKRAKCGTTCGYTPNQRDLQLIVGDAESPPANGSTVLWEHRAVSRREDRSGLPASIIIVITAERWT